LLAPLVCFVAGSVYVAGLSATIQAASLSIATNGGPSVVYLSIVRDDIRRIEQHAMAARPGSVAQDRAAIASLTDELERAEIAELETPQYPGEREADQAVQRTRATFFAAVKRLLDRADDGLPASEEAIARLLVAANDLSSAVGRKSQINADQVTSAGDTIARLSRRAMVLSVARDALAFAFVVSGTALGIRASRRQAALAEARRRLDEERVAELDVFAGRVAHDLRDVVGLILMRASMGERAKTLDASTEVLAHIVRHTHRMNATIDALLTFARAAARPEPGSRSDVAKVMQDVVADLQPAADEARVEVVVELLRAAVVACDPVVLGVVLANLVRNALKYMGDGSRRARRITLRGYRRGAHLRIEVEDTGPGLPAGSEVHVFDPFFRAQRTAHTAHGVGLGLATVKRLVEANGGEVGVDSRPCVGCRFWFTLPLAGVGLVDVDGRGPVDVKG
jgi:signal transduction histidine kinase